MLQSLAVKALYTATLVQNLGLGRPHLNSLRLKSLHTHYTCTNMYCICVVQDIKISIGFLEFCKDMLEKRCGQDGPVQPNEVELAQNDVVFCAGGVAESAYLALSCLVKLIPGEVQPVTQ